MFFPEKITKIYPSDKVLEVGPGSTPHPRSNEFLDLKFNDDKDRILQRGNIAKEPSFNNRPIHYYNGLEFPFEDNAFDYVICSHVIEHVADPPGFLKEIFRVGKGRGYLEYPLITYEYLYDFNVHLNFIKYDFEKKILRYLPKSDTAFSDFSVICALFHETLTQGWDDLCITNKNLFFEGFEFHTSFSIENTSNIEKFIPDQSLIIPKKPLRKRIGQLLNKLKL